jgi:hypothetical protein
MPSTLTDRLDGLSTSVAVKAPVKAVATANITLSGEQTVNGVAVVDGDRVLVTAQNSSVDNGIYDVSTSAWSRAQDFDGNRDVRKGTLVVANTSGSIYYRVTTADPVTIGSSAVTFEAVAGAVSQTSIGETFYPRSDEEISASVTPVNYFKPYAHVLRYATNTVPGTTDMATAIGNSLAAYDYCDIERERCAIGSAISMTTNQCIVGDGKGLASIETLANTYDAIKIGTADNVGAVSSVDSRRNVLRGFKITSQGGIGASNAGIRIDDATSGTRGSVDNYFADLFIGGDTGDGNGFKYGIYGDDLTWNNTFARIWFEDNERNVRLIGSSNISNLWDRCYFHESDETVQHFYIFHCKQNVFNVCNWGGRKVQLVDETDDAIEFGSACQGIKFVGNNFENFKFGTTGLAVIVAGDGCGVSVDSCTFVEIDAAAGVDAYFMRSNDNSMFTVHNSVTQNEGTTGTLYHFGAEGLGKFEVYDYQPAATGAATHKGLTTIGDIGGTGNVRFHNVPAQQLISPKYNLDATGTIKDVLLCTDKPIQIGSVKFLYTEASSSDAGIVITVAADTDSDFAANSTISALTTQVSKAAGTTTAGTLTTEKFNAGPVTVFTSATLNKTGAGEGHVVVDFWYRGGN